MHGCDHEALCAARFERFEAKLDAALALAERVGRLEASARVLGWVLTTLIAVGALYLGTK